MRRSQSKSSSPTARGPFLPGKAETVLILGGTKEAAALAAELVAAHPHWRVITSLAGRTKEPKPVAGEVRIGGFGGAEGLADYLRREHITSLIDATHPFARQISANAIRAAELTGIPLETRTRPPWQKQPGDNWLEVASLEAARDAIPPARACFWPSARSISPPSPAAPMCISSCAWWTSRRRRWRCRIMSW